jgi:hypothetical protein
MRKSRGKNISNQSGCKSSTTVEPKRGAQPRNTIQDADGEAEPRLTAGGESVAESRCGKAVAEKPFGKEPFGKSRWYSLVEAWFPPPFLQSIVAPEILKNFYLGSW